MLSHVEAFNREVHERAVFLLRDLSIHMSEHSASTSGTSSALEPLQVDDKYFRRRVNLQFFGNIAMFFTDVAIPLVVPREYLFGREAVEAGCEIKGFRRAPLD